MTNVKELADATPVTRDRYVDLLRAASIAFVVVGHWLGAVVTIEGGRVVARSLLQRHPGLWPLTWVFQVMPLFFFAGGFANAVSLDSARRRGQDAAGWLRSRVSRLLRPTGAFLAAWLVVQALLHAADAGGGGRIRLSMLPFGPLWFLAVYLVVVSLAPVMLAAHRRYRWGVVGVLCAGAATVDAVGLWGGHGAVRWANFAFVWLLAHQVGFFYADGTLTRSRRVPALLAAAGFVSLIVLTSAGYPRSMVGVDGQPVSNMNPPTICIVAMTAWAVGAAMMLRTPASRWLARPRPWMAVIAANRLAMTVYLWHLTALLVAVLALRIAGIGARPAIVGASTAVLVALVAAFARFDPAGGPRQAMR